MRFQAGAWVRPEYLLNFFRIPRYEFSAMGRDFSAASRVLFRISAAYKPLIFHVFLLTQDVERIQMLQEDDTGGTTQVCDGY